MLRMLLICTLIFTAAFLFAMRSVTAAVYASGTESWGAEHFERMYSHVGSGLTVWAVISLIAAILLLLSFATHTIGRKREDAMAKEVVAIAAKAQEAARTDKE